MSSATLKTDSSTFGYLWPSRQLGLVAYNYQNQCQSLKTSFPEIFCFIKAFPTPPSTIKQIKLALSDIILIFTSSELWLAKISESIYSYYPDSQQHQCNKPIKISQISITFKDCQINLFLLSWQLAAPMLTNQLKISQNLR